MKVTLQRNTIIEGYIIKDDKGNILCRIEAQDFESKEEMRKVAFEILKALTILHL